MPSILVLDWAAAGPENPRTKVTSSTVRTTVGCIGPPQMRCSGQEASVFVAPAVKWRGQRLKGVSPHGHSTRDRACRLNTMSAEDASQGFDQRKAESFAGRILSALNNGALCLMMSVGHRTGLFD